MAESFGRYLRRERQMRDISLEEISADTKIKQSLLEALESDRIQALPSVAIVKGFLRAYARILGLSANDLQIRYQSFLTEVDPSRLETLRQRPWVPRKRRRLPRVAWLLLLALGAGVGLHLRGGESPLGTKSEQAFVERRASRVVFRKNYLQDLETEAPPGTPPFVSAASPPGIAPEGGGLYLLLRALAPVTARVVLDGAKPQSIALLPGDTVIRYAGRVAVVDSVDPARLLIEANGSLLVLPGSAGRESRMTLRVEGGSTAEGGEVRGLPRVTLQDEPEGENLILPPVSPPELHLPKPSKLLPGPAKAVIRQRPPRPYPVLDSRNSARSPSDSQQTGR